MRSAASSGYDVLLNSSGPKQLDMLDVELTSNTLLGDEASPHGLVDSLLYGRLGHQVDAVGPYVPGVDAPHRIDIVNTYANDGRPMARKVISQANPAVLHVGLDMPNRFNALYGIYPAKKLSTFVLSLCGRIADVSGSDIAIYHNNGSEAGLIYEGTSTDLYYAYNQIEGRIARHTIEDTAPNLRGLLRQIGNNIDPNHDAAFVVSDFLSGYNAQTGTFDWSGPFQLLHADLGDRLWSTRITSPFQRAIPAGVSKDLTLDAVDALNKSYENTAVKKDATIDAILQGTRSLRVDTTTQLEEQHPVRRLSQFVLGRTAE